VLDSLLDGWTPAPRWSFPLPESTSRVPSRGAPSGSCTSSCTATMPMGCRWSGAGENRPALAVIARGIRIDIGHARFDAVLADRIDWLLSLNPHDNQGLRHDLMPVLLELDRSRDALALADRYPDDLAAMRYNGALALYRPGDREAATAALGDAAVEYPRVLRLLRAKAPREPAAAGPGILLGGDEEAWLYRRDHYALWEREGALDWARAAVPVRRR
jgi:hypothetical protein